MIGVVDGTGDPGAADAGAGVAGAPHLDLDGFEGPLDLLLTLAQAQKVDLREISILSLAEQYLAFIERAREIRIELAADWLVMAAWLAYLKSRLLLPPDPDDENTPSSDELAARLAFRLARLDAMRRAGARLMARPLLGQDRFARAAPEPVRRSRETRWGVGLMDLMAAYARLRTRDEFRPFAFDRTDTCTMEEALAWMRGLVGAVPEWRALAHFLPQGWQASPARRRSALVATFAASLELAREGAVDLRQAGSFAPITVRARRAGQS